MDRQDDSLTLSKKGKREVSSFIGHELLYDYLSNTLDDERKSAIEDHIKFSRDAQLDLGKIQNGQSYAEQLSSTIVSQPIVDHINAPSSYLNVLMQKTNFDKWPQGLKWGLEALVVVVVIVSLLLVVPWEKAIQIGLNSGTKEVILAEVAKTPQTESPEEDVAAFVDEDIKGHKEAAVPAVAATKPMEVKIPDIAAAPVVDKVDKGMTKPVKEPVKPTPAPEPTKVAAATAAPTPTPAAAASGGFLYRGEIAVTNIEIAGPKITDKILELGGRKAGDVELGWSKTPTSKYYHFTIPEAKQAELNAFLETYGTAQIKKEKHPRVMPDGIIRLIITLDETKQ